MSELRIIVPDNCRELGEKVNQYIREIRGTNEDYIIYMDKQGLIRFNNGEGKCVLPVSVRNTDLYISSGIGTSEYGFRLFNRPSINFYRIVKR